MWKSKVISFLLPTVSMFTLLFLLGALPPGQPERLFKSYLDCGTLDAHSLPCMAMTQVPPVTTATENQHECTTTSSTVLAANTRRVELRIKNISETVVYVCERGTDPCETTVGNPWGQDFSTVDDRYQGTVTCITASGTATLYWGELSRP